MWFAVTIYLSIIFTTFPFDCGELEPIPAVIGRKMGYTQNR